MSAKNSASHDKLAFRLTQILIKLNQGDKLDPQALADEFGVNLRTIQRDLNERFSYLPFERTDGRYYLDPAYLGRFSLRDLEQFAALAGVAGLFPSLSVEFLRDILESRLDSALLVKGQYHEELRVSEPQFRQIEDAIAANRLVSFDYRRVDITKRYLNVQPYRLLQHDGIWYLAALDDGKLKAFAFARIERLQLQEGRFQPDAAVQRSLLQGDGEGLWAQAERKTVVLRVAREVVGHFRRRKLLSNQQIVQECNDGSLLISGEVAYANQILPIVRYWIPNVRIVSPDGLQAELERIILAYLEAGRTAPGGALA